MKKLRLLTKSLLVVAALLMGANAWADGNKRTLYSQNYESVATTDWTCPNGTSTLETGDATYGNYAKCTANTANGDRSCYKSVSYTAGTGSTSANMSTTGYNIEFDILLQSGSYSTRAQAEFIVTTSGPNLATNAYYSGTDYIFSLSQPTRDASSYSTTWYINDLGNTSTKTVTLDNNTWYHVKLTVTASSVDYSINGVTGSKSVDALPTIKGFWSLIGRGYDASHCGIMQFDNLDIYDYSLLPQMAKTWSMDFKALAASVLNSVSNTSTSVTKSSSVSFSDAASHDFYTITNDGFNSNFGVTGQNWQVRYYGSTKEANTGLWPYNISSNRYMAIQNLKRNAWVAYTASAAVTASSNSVASTATGVTSDYVFQIPAAGTASFTPTNSSYVYSVEVYEPVNEVIGLLDKSSAYMGQFKTMTIKKGEVLKVNFKNRGQNDQNYHNWAIRFYNSEINRALTADNRINGGDAGFTYGIDMDGATMNWDDFKDQMQDAEVEMIITYAADGTFSISASSACSEHTYNHTMSYGTALSNDLTLELGVDGSWMEVMAVEKKLPVTISALDYSTLASDYDLDFTTLSSSLKAYKATVSGSTITFTAVTTVPAGEGVLLKAVDDLDAPQTFNIPVTTGVAAWDADENAFVRGTGVAVATGSGPYNYVLSTKSGVVGFYQANDNVVPANKAYLQSATDHARIAIGFEDETTGINSVQGSGLKVNGSEAVYNLQGQRVAQPGKGLYIMNGKKVIMK